MIERVRRKKRRELRAETSEVNEGAAVTPKLSAPLAYVLESPWAKTQSVWENPS